MLKERPNLNVMRKKNCLMFLNLMMVLSIFVSSSVSLNALESKKQFTDVKTDAKALVLSVTFNDETASDISGNNNHGRVAGDVEYVEGVSGKAIHIQNNDVAYTSAKAQQYVNFGTPSDLQFGTDSFSILFWVKQDGDKVTDGTIISNKDWNTGRNKGFAVADYDNKQTLNFTTEGSSRADTSGIATLDDEGWHHVSAVYDRSGDMILYVDGEEIAKKDIRSQAGKRIDASDFVLGADGLTHYGMEDIYIDELEVYRSALSKDEITEMNKDDFFRNKLNQLQIKIQEYEILLEEMAASQDKKQKFIDVIQDVSDQAKQATDIASLGVLMTRLKSAYNDFCQPDKGISEFVVVSDTHVGASASSSSAVNFTNALNDIKTFFPDVNLVLNAGDFASDGGDSEFNRYFSILDAYKSDFNFMNALGNHDVRWNTGWTDMYNRYMRHNAQYMGGTKDVYHDQWVEGYHYIVLNTEYDLKDRAFISNEQLQWLDKTMAEGAEKDKPIFVVLHQPLRDTYYNSNEWDAGMQDFALKEVLRKYPQTILFSGHIHNGLGTGEVIETEYGTVVDLPGFLSNDYGDPRGQLGYHVAIYEDEVQLSMRDFASDEWLPTYNYVIDLNKNKSVNGKILDVSFDDETANDTSGKDNHGTIVGDVSFTDGVIGKAIHITNDENATTATQYVDFGSDERVQLGKDDFSILFWYKGTKENNVEGSIISNKNWDTGNNQGFTIGSFTDPRPGIGLNFTPAEGTRRDTERFDEIVDGNWHHVAATFDRDGFMTLYMDGNILERKDISSDIDKTIDVEGLSLILGADGKLQYPVHDSYIDELKIYRKVLKEAELETVVTPFKVETDETKAVITWDALDSNLEPAHFILNEEKIDIPSDVDHYTIENLQTNTEYSIKIVTREKSIKRNLRDAYSIDFSTLASKADTSQLRDKIMELEALKEWEYTEDSWAILQIALDDATLVLEQEKPTQEVIDAAMQALQEAYDQLAYDVDAITYILKSLIDKTDRLIEDQKLDHLAPNVAMLIRTRLAEAKAIYASVDVSNETCIEAWLNLANALHYMDFIADKSDLEMLIQVCETIDLSEYTSGIVAFEEALTKAKEVYENDDVLQDTINTAYQTLSKAKDGLVKHTVNKTFLHIVVSSIKTSIGDENKYQQNEAWELFKHALTNAETVLMDDKALQEDVDAALHALTNAYVDIRLLPDEELLKQLSDFIAFVNHVDLTQYRDDIVFQALFVKEKAVMMLQNPENIKEERFVQLQSEMAEVLELLVNYNMVNPAPSVEQQPTLEHPASESAKLSNNEAVKPGTIKTGDTTNVAQIGILLISSAVIVRQLKRKKK